MNIRSLVQQTLDTVLNPLNVYVFHQRKEKIKEKDLNEYIVYKISGNSNEAFADDAPLIKATDVTVRYYYRTEIPLSTVDSHETLISNAMEVAGFTTNGPFDVGDIDDIGFYTSVFEFTYERVV